MKKNNPPAWSTEGRFSWLRPTLLDRARKRWGAISRTSDPNLFVLGGTAKFSDCFDEYQVRRITDLEWSCSCHGHLYGSSRKLCSHIMAVRTWLDRPQMKPFTDEELAQVKNGKSIPASVAPQPNPDALEAQTVAPNPLDEGWGDQADPVPDKTDHLFQPTTPEEWAKFKPPAFETIRPAWLEGLDLPSWVKGLRHWQVEAIDEVMRAFEAGFRFVFLEAPTGAGKTLIAEAIRQRVGREIENRQRAARANFICTTKSLQDQFVHDFPESTLIKGKSNYPTANFPELFNPTGKGPTGGYDWRIARDHLSCGECDYTKDRGCSWCSRKNDEHPGQARWRCPYNKARKTAMQASLSVLNTAFFIGVCNFSPLPQDDPDEGTPGFKGRELAILDEADLIEGVLMSQVEVNISKKRMEQLGIDPPEKKTVATCWASWIRDKAIPAAQLLLAKIQNDEKMRKLQKIKKTNSIGRLVDNLQLVLENMDEGDTQWVYDGYKKGAVVFKPIKVKIFGEKLLWQHAKRFLVMSATFIAGKRYARDLGVPIEGFKYVRVPSSFPVEQRPVYVDPVAKNTLKNREEAWPKIAQRVCDLTDKHIDQKILVHTVSYGFTEHILKALKRHIAKSSNPKRLIVTYANSAEREKALESYKSGPPGTIALAPSWDRGIDLPGDLCRVQIIAKIPYPNLGDKQIAARLHSKGGDFWYAMETIRTLCQMTGRGMRRPDDWCATYILDKQVSSILREHKKLLPEWWANSIVKTKEGNR